MLSESNKYSRTLFGRSLCQAISFKAHSDRVKAKISFMFVRPRTKYEGRYCLRRCLSVHISGGGYPIPGPGRGGTPSQVQVGEYDIPGLDGGYPIPCLDGGVPQGPPPIWDWMGYPLPHPGLDGVPHPHPGLDGGSPPPSRTWWGIPLWYFWLFFIFFHLCFYFLSVWMDLYSQSLASRLMFGKSWWSPKRVSHELVIWNSSDNNCTL